jgi:membrane protein YdbS with pleckstrin-like domain
MFVAEWDRPIWTSFLLGNVGQMLHDSEAEWFVERHSGALTILVLALLLLVALLILVPQLLRARQRALELHHTEVMAALEKGQTLPGPDDRSRAAGRTAMLVPMVSIISAAIVTCFLSAFKPDSIFSVALAVWTVAGVVSLAAITGGVALMGRLAQIQNGMDPDADAPDAELLLGKEREEQR